ncbi:MAG: hypothetical protein ABIO45_04040 [Burkholderiaceae bacterium]
MLNCKGVAELCSEEMERSLRLREKIALGAHLWMCSGCANYRRQMTTLREVAQAYAAGQAIMADPEDVHPPRRDGE